MPGSWEWVRKKSRKKRITDFFPFETAEQYLKDDRNFMEKGHPEEKEERVPRDGKERVEQVAKFPIRNEAGEVAGILGIIPGTITEKKGKRKGKRRRAGKKSPWNSLAFSEVRTEEWKDLSEKFQSEESERRRLEENSNNIGRGLSDSFREYRNGGGGG